MNATVLASLDGTQSGGWATVLGKQPTDPLTEQDIDRIVDHVRRVAQASLQGQPFIQWLQMIPGLSMLIPSQVDAATSSIRTGLAPYVGRPIAEVPNDLGKLEAVRSGVPGFTGDLLYGNNWVTQLVGGLGDVVGRAGLLVGIVILGLIGVRQMVNGVGR